MSDIHPLVSRAPFDPFHIALHEFLLNLERLIIWEEALPWLGASGHSPCIQELLSK